MVRRVPFYLVLILALALGSCGGGGGGGSSNNFVLATAPVATAGAGTGTTMGVLDANLARDAVDWVNAHRVANGLSALPWNAAVAQVAYNHCVDMDVRNFFDHVNPSNQDPGDRLAAAAIGNTGWGENIAMGQPTGQAVAEAWMNSPGHRNNILSSNWTSMGMGAYSVGGTIYWTNVFVRQ